MKILSKNSIQLCKGNGCCPIIELNNNKVNIKDDFGGQINIDLEQAELIESALKLLKTNIKIDK